jgi:hypothetical protein
MTNVNHGKLIKEAEGDVKRQREIIQDFVNDVLVEGEDYGEIPGFEGKPTLFKSGAEKLLVLFGAGRKMRIVKDNFYPDATTTIQKWNKKNNGWEDKEYTGCFIYEVECDLFDKITGMHVGSGIGGTNSFEKKFVSQGDCYQTQNNIMKMAGKRCLGSTTPILVKTKNTVIRTNLSKLYTLFEAATNDVYVPAPDGKWVRINGIKKEENRTVFKIKMNDGSYIRASDNHIFPTKNGLKTVNQLKKDDVLIKDFINLKPYEKGSQAHSDIAWAVGLYLADGNLGTHTDDNILYTLNAKKEVHFIERLKTVCDLVGSNLSYRVDENTLRISISGKAFSGLIRQFIDGDKSYGKHLSRYAWQQGPSFLNELLTGYIDGDGYINEKGYVEIGFTAKNDDLLHDLQTLCNILDKRFYYSKKLASSIVDDDKKFPVYNVTIKENGNHLNHKDLNKILSIEEETKKGTLYDIEVDSEDHLFLLATGIVTHNSMVDAALSLSLVSGMFTQDVEDMDKDDAPTRSSRSSAPANNYAAGTINADADDWEVDFGSPAFIGKMLSSLPEVSLRWYATAVQKNIDSGKFVEKNNRILAIIKKVAANKGVAI